MICVSTCTKMLFPIDLIFLSKEKEVVYIEEHVRPFRISEVSLRAESVLELPAHAMELRPFVSSIAAVNL
jgi:uncharacterized membrane protein (UPF0127 family)